jgi:hypothetical protein
LDLPSSEYIQPINENDLKTNYINPFMQHFVDNDLNLLKWPEVNHKDRIHRTSRRKAADAILYSINQDKLGQPFGFAEVKSQKQEKKIRNLTLDLYRLVHFAKDSIDNANFKNILLFQSVGAKTTFYMLTLLNEALYCTFELFKIKIPLHYDQITSLTLTDINNLCSLQHLFNQCKPCEIPASLKRTSLLTPELSTLVCNSQSKGAFAIDF